MSIKTSKCTSQIIYVIIAIMNKKKCLKKGHKKFMNIKEKYQTKNERRKIKTMITTMITLEQQQLILKLHEQYQNTDKSIISANLKEYMDKKRVRPATIAKETGIAIQSIYQLRKANSNYKPDFITALVLCNLLEIPITDILNDDIELNTPEQKSINTKWTREAKEQFLGDYNSLSVTDLCKRYKITPRTAQEYNRVFRMDLEID